MKRIVQLRSTSEVDGKFIEEVYPITSITAIKTEDDKNLEDYLEEKLSNLGPSGSVTVDEFDFNNLTNKPFSYIASNITNNDSSLTCSTDGIILGDKTFIGKQSILKRSIWSKTTSSIQIQRTESEDLEGCKLLISHTNYYDKLNFFDLIEDYVIDNNTSSSSTTITFTNVVLPESYLSLEAYFIKDASDIGEVKNAISIGYGNFISNDFSIASGYFNTASGNMSSASGFKSESTGDYSHAEGIYSKATGDAAHAEGNYTKAEGKYSHAEGYNTTASGTYSHAEGYSATSVGSYSHAEGYYSNSKGDYAHAEGYQSLASGNYSHAEGGNTESSGQYSHAEGYGTKASGKYSHAEGYKNTTDILADNSHAEGNYNTVRSKSGHAEGVNNFAGSYTVVADTTATEVSYDYYKIYKNDNIQVDDIITLKSGGVFSAPIEEIVDNNNGTISLCVDWIDSDVRNYRDIVIVRNTNYTTEATHVEGRGNIAAKNYSHAEGSNNFVDGENSHAEGSNNVIYSQYSHAEGYNNFINAESSHAEGHVTFSGKYEIIANVPTATYISTYVTQIGAEFIGKIKAGDIIIPNDNYVYKIYTITKVQEETDNVKITIDKYFSNKQFTIIRYGSNSTSAVLNTHTEGRGSIACGSYAHAEGFKTQASGEASHAGGVLASASGYYSYAHGYNAKATQTGSHAEGSNTLASGNCAHAEGAASKATATAAHAEGASTASGSHSHAEGYVTVASGDYSHAGGYQSTASGNYSYAQGQSCTASAINSHAEGYNTTASGQYSHAECYYTEASGDYSHAEGYRTKATGTAAHAEGYSTTASNYAHAEGYRSEAIGHYSHAEGKETKANNSYSHAEGYRSETNAIHAHAEGHTSFANGENSHAEGQLTIASGLNSHSEGLESNALGENSHAEGYRTMAISGSSHAEGKGCISGNLVIYATVESISRFTDTIYYIEKQYSPYLQVGRYLISTKGTFDRAKIKEAVVEETRVKLTLENAITYYSYPVYIAAPGASTVDGAHAEGYGTIANGDYSHAEGQLTHAKGFASHAGGYGTVAKGLYSRTTGSYTIASKNNQLVIGRYNIEDTQTAEEKQSAFIIGNGSTTTRSNAFKVAFDGNVYAAGSVSSNGADYAEMFEWNDGNINCEDRVGKFVTFEEGTGKIRIANSNDKYILGVVSATASIVGDRYEDEWNEKYITDDFGRIQYEEKIINEVLTRVPILNKNYNPEQQYISRTDRKEWDAIGMLGKLFVLHDGTCNVGDYCVVNNEGIATKSDSGYYVLSANNEVAKILFR